MDITINLNKTSIDRAIRQIKSYAKQLESNNEKFVEALCGIGEPIADSIVGSVTQEDLQDCSVSVGKVERNGGECSCTLNLNGSDSAFIEFGAGMKYAVPQNPLASENGMGVGTYPGQTHAFDPDGWNYWENGEKKHSFGNPPYAPLYEAGQHIELNVVDVAKNTFKK